MNKPIRNIDWHTRRMRAEKRFRFYGLMALMLAVLVLVVLLGSLITRGYSGFLQTQIKVPVTFDTASLPLEEGRDNLRLLPASNYNRLVHDALLSQFPEVKDRKDRRQLYALVTNSGVQLKRMMLAQEQLPVKMELWLPASSVADLYNKGSMQEGDRRFNDKQAQWFAKLKEQGRVRLAFNSTFFSRADSRSPEKAGFLGAITGSALTLIICLLCVFPVGVMTAIYLEEFARKGRWVEIIEVNINNLAAVPSIVFGLLGLAVYINLMHMPRSASLVGGLTLALMILPVIIIATRAALKSVPGSIRDAARALGASPVQVVWHHTLPLSMPGVMTGTILGMARAIGETAPLLMIGMVAFIADVPGGFTAPATAMPVQIYLWAGSPEAGFAEKTAAGILVLLVLLLAMNALAIFLRKRFEVRW